MVIAAVVAVPAGCGSSDRGRVVSVPWSLVHAEGRRLTIESISGGCESFDHAGTEETNQRVTVAVYNLLRQKVGEACTADAIFTRSMITLHHPLGSRRLVHARVTTGRNPKG
jgi:hypothetical protein